MTQNLATRTALRPAHPEDFNYCARLYFEGMENIIKELNLNMDAHAAGFRRRRFATAGHWHRGGQRLDRRSGEGRPDAHSRSGKDQSRSAALRTARVSHYA